jgi:hypothetical protein
MSEHMSEDAVARRMWALYEPVHLMTYFGPQALAAFEEAGLRGFWRGYFAGRSAPLGTPDAPPVIAAFFGFAPSFVRRALPSVWNLISPADALRVREAGAVAVLRTVLGYRDGQAADPSVSAAADLLLAATRDLDGAGRPLGGPNAAISPPAEPLARLWYAATVLREHRGDGHIAALVAADIDGCESLVLAAAVDAAAGGGISRALLQPVRGWTDEQWDAAAARLTVRGWLDEAGTVTPAGQAARAAVEAATDAAAARPWASLGPARTAELADLLRPVAQACAAGLPFPNPVGIPVPAAP